ncbi:hypothetical protein BDB00DRAFT_826763 [Zychaea mexicana]|uniref:uncharacterized protein n=1 Tax=Zychaea mexicana TaxID=64656 RepID=UPI0022FE7EBF|nr:uncharacterized protein BDB00DRAFT_826763 [Zychaea mexicana]KAI9492687.1 hypothetical protein BDB00DRAFT_826763 [Zychaea mexicana]
MLLLLLLSSCSSFTVRYHTTLLRFLLQMLLLLSMDVAVVLVVGSMTSADAVVRCVAVAPLLPAVALAAFEASLSLSKLLVKRHMVVAIKERKSKSSAS